MQERQHLRLNLPAKKIEAGRVAARPGEAGDQPKLDRVFAHAEDDRDCRSCSFGCDRNGRGGGQGDNGHTTAD
jgi:hypothetical protein